MSNHIFLVKVLNVIDLGNIFVLEIKERILSMCLS